MDMGAKFIAFRKYESGTTILSTSNEEYRNLKHPNQIYGCKDMAVHWLRF